MNTHCSSSLRLEPMNHPELGDILIDGCLFPIGRLEVPFSSHKSEAVTKLSRRHARIFQENNGFYLADLGSMNGTTVNGQTVKQLPVLLKDGDEVSFADIRYGVVVQNGELLEQTEVIEPDSVQVTLVPNAQSGGDPIVINRFPFLVSKSTGVFSQYKELFDVQLQYISRRHAHIYLQGRSVFVEDLGSTNGTFVCGERLDEHARELQDNDTIAFGPEECEFQIRVRKQPVRDGGAGQEPLTTVQADDEVLADETGEGFVEYGTILVDKASPFLDIFYDQIGEEEASVESELELSQAKVSPGEYKVGKRSRGWLNKVRVFWSELQGVFAEEPRKGRPGKVVWIGVLLLVFGGSFAFYQHGTVDRELRTLLELGDYEAAAVLANRLLSESPQSEKIRQLSHKAILNYAIPDWQQAIEQHNFDRALELSRNTLVLAQANQETRELFEVVDWMSALERYVIGLKADQPLVIYQNEADLKALTEQWQNNASEYRRRLGIILREVPAFKNTHVQVLSHLRLLQNYASVYLKAIDELKAEINLHLAQNQMDKLRDRLLSFQNKYPKIGGIDLLLSDLDSYLSLERDLDQKRLIPLLRQTQSLQLYTAPFKQIVAQRIVSVLPPAEVSARYLESEAAWKAGHAEQAIGMLGSLSKEPWGNVAQVTIERNQRIHRQFEIFRQEPKPADYDIRLVRYYSELDTAIDIYYRTELQDEFLRAKGQVKNRADDHFREAEKHWQGYRAAGGITGLLRLEDRVSKRYRQRASLLTTAQSSAIRGGASYTLLQLDLLPPWKELKANIQNELRRQRNWLLDLQKVLPPELVQSKLGLLKVKDENTAL